MRSKFAIPAGLLILLAGWIVLTGAYPFVVWSPINCRYEDVDINTGRIRHQRFWLRRCVQEEFKDSPISSELQLAGVAPNWQRVNTFSPLVSHSPHYAYHSAIAQTASLEATWKLGEFSPSARKTSCQRLLRLWQQGRGDAAADNYLRALSTLAIERRGTQLPITAADLPEDLLQNSH